MRLIESISPLEVRAGTRLASALAGFALILLASGLWRHKRTAWGLTLVVLALSTVSHLAKGLDYEEAFMAFAIGLALFLSRKYFQALSDTPTLKRGFIILGIALVFTLVYGSVGFYFLDRHFAAHFNVLDASSQTIRMFTSFTDPGVIATTRFGRYFTNSIYVIAICTLGYAFFALLSPVIVHNPAVALDRKRAEEIIRNYGRTVLARFCLFPDKHYYFSPGGSVIAYVSKARSALVLGDPIGPHHDLPETVRGFRNLCFQNDWTFAFYQTLPDYLAVYHAEGLHAIKIGEEAIIPLASFTLQGGAMKSIRTNVNKLTHLGWKSETFSPPHPAVVLSELRSVSSEWLAARKSKEMRYSMGWFDEDYLNTTPVIAIRNETGLIMAFANIVDEYNHREAAVDLMRHCTGALPGTMDYLFSEMLQYAKSCGYERFNLGLSGLAGVGNTSADPIIEHAMHYLYENVKTGYNFKGLHHFKDKFNPIWEPRYLVYAYPASLPQLAVALAQVSA